LVFLFLISYKNYDKFIKYFYNHFFYLFLIIEFKCYIIEKKNKIHQFK
jgi:hypothetical protein